MPRHLGEYIMYDMLALIWKSSKYVSFSSPASRSILLASNPYTVKASGLTKMYAVTV